VPDLIAILSNAASSMAAQRALSATAAHNIQNANTAGYSRQRAELAATLPADSLGGVFIGRGAYLASVTQVRDRFLEAQVPRALGEAARSSAEAEALASVHVLDPERAGSLAAALGGFYGTLRALSQNPGEQGLRSAVLGAARSLASSFERTAAGLEGARAGVDARVVDLVAEVNASARAVAEANATLQRTSGAGAAPNDLLDLRQKHLDRLAELTGATAVAQSDGSIAVLLPGGGALVSGARAGALATEADPASSGLLSLRLAGVDGSDAALPAAAVGGAIGGAFAARDGALRAALAAVDALAADVAGGLNAVHAGAWVRDPVGGQWSQGGPLFASAGGGPITARGLRVAVTEPWQLATASAAGAASGDPAVVQALVDTEGAPVRGGPDVQAALSALTSAFGAESQRATAWAEQDEGLRDEILAMREGRSGVSIDEELIEMQKAQRAFEAIAKVIQVADEMTRTLMQLR
jgi:flagellar hook-associated protein 1 FlgK